MINSRVLIEEFWKNAMGITNMMLLPKLVEISTICSMKKGETVIHKGEEVDVIPFVMSGIYEMCDMDDDGRKYTDGFVWKCGTPLVAVAKLQKKSLSELTVQALESGQILYAPLDKMIHLTSTYRELQDLQLEILYQVIDRYREKSQVLIAKPAREKLEWFYRSHQEIVNRINQKEMASYLGIHEKSLSRLLRN